jgi:long-chain acyl-CoA synthetase
MHDVLTTLSSFAGVYDGAAIFSDGEREITRAGLASEALRVASLLENGPNSIGILFENSVGAAVAQLAGWAAGKTVVPLPWFFSEAQLGYVVQDAGLAHCIASDGLAPLAFKLGLKNVNITSLAAPLSVPKAGGGQIIYTSGSTGRPKGVRLPLAQIDASARQLAVVSDASRGDKYLSILPLPLLLETICAICVPLITRARAHFDTATCSRVARGDAGAVAAAFAASQPTISVLVPELLASWVGTLKQTRTRAPKSLRFVAVGGAPVSMPLAEEAWSLGIPAYEGYGLSECCSVVSVNRPGARRSGTVGRPLPNVSVRIDAGEIVVEGPTVMSGYLHQPDVSGSWRTGDLGDIDDDGNLIVRGRKDNMIVTSYGRNVSPEWIEALILTDERLSAAAIVGHGAPHLTAVLVGSPVGASWLTSAPKAQLLLALAAACKNAPAYALPRDVIVLTRDFIAERNLMTANGRWQRGALVQVLQEIRARDEKHEVRSPNFEGKSPMNFYDTLLERTTVERNAFLSIPLIQDAIRNGASRALYIDFLAQAYHHVKHTFSELALAASLTTDETYQDALVEYMNEERGHEKWILNDIRALGGDAEDVSGGVPSPACQVLVGYTYFAIQHISPYALLGSVHVLEGMSTALADKAADAIKTSLSVSGEEGFSYLRSHGALDVEHVAFFKTLANTITDPAVQNIVVETAKIIYRLYGDIFRELEIRHARQRHAA